MTIRGEIVILILLCMLVTIVPRVLPFLAAHRLRLAPWAVTWFRFLPPAILAALLFSGLLLPNGELSPNIISPEILAAFFAAAVSIKTRSIIITVIAGMLGYALIANFYHVIFF